MSSRLAILRLATLRLVILRLVRLMTLGAALLCPAAALADFTPATLVSGAALVPFGEATNPALSGDGRYVVFQGTLAGEPGIYRRDLLTGAIQLVAGVKLLDGVLEEESPVPAPDASAPSVSADGRYVAFTSAAVLVNPGEDMGSHGCPQVYVRDMESPISAPGAYTLASALDGQNTSLAYAGSCPSLASSQLALGGAQAAPGVALSANGRQVVFTVLSQSDLTSGDEASPETPASQVAVRDLDTRTTTLVSATPREIGPGGAVSGDQATPGGGAFPSTESEQRGVRSLDTASSQPTGSTAAISADGSTVAWLGANIPLQVPSASDVAAGMASLGPVATEVEPLWRRIADGGAAATRRLLNEAGLNFYFQGSAENAEAVSGGSLYPGSQDFVAPVLSADGETVATIANAPTPGNQGSYAFLGFRAPTPADAYVIRVNDDLATPPQVTPLTATPSFTAPNAIYSGVGDVAISPDGSRVGFNTRRTSFALSPPTLISPPAPEVDNEYTYEANLALGSLQRVTTTYDGSAPDGNPGLMSFSQDGQSLALASTASNLFYGDATTGVSQVYLVNELPTASQVATESLSPAPVASLPAPSWTLSATASPQPNGAVLVEAEVPGAGQLGARASAQLLPPASASRSRDHTKPRTSARARARMSSGHRALELRQQARAAVTSQQARAKLTKATDALKSYTVAQAGAAAHGASELHLSLRVSTRYRSLVAGREGLYCTVRLTFSAPGHRQLVQQIPVTFRARKAADGAKRQKTSAKTVRSRAKTVRSRAKTVRSSKHASSTGKSK